MNCTVLARQRYVALGRQNGRSCGLCGERILRRFVEPQQGLARESDTVVGEGRRCGVAIAEPTTPRRAGGGVGVGGFLDIV